MRLEVVTASGRGVHLATPGHHEAICMRLVLARHGPRRWGQDTPSVPGLRPRPGRSGKELEMRDVLRRHDGGLIDLAPQSCLGGNLREQLRLRRPLAVSPRELVLLASGSGRRWLSSLVRSVLKGMGALGR